MNYQKVASVGELKPGTMKKVLVGETPVLLANLEGAYYAIPDTCPHMGGSLSKGKLEGDHVICPRHGSVFDLRTGKLVKRGKILLIPAIVHDTRSYPVKIDGADIFVAVDE